MEIKFEWSWETSKRAECWGDFYDCIPESGPNRGIPHVACKSCHARYFHPNLTEDRSPSSLQRHAKTCNRLDRIRYSSHSDQNPFREWFEAKDHEKESKGTADITKELVTEAVLDFFISGDILFNQAENPQFKSLMNLIRIPIEQAPKDQTQIIRTKSVTAPSRKILRSRLDEYVVKAKEQLREQLQENDSKVSLALDLWTGGANYAFMGIPFIAFMLTYCLAVTAHWVDQQFCLRDALLAFRQVHGRHCGVNLGTILYSVIEDYGIQDRLFCCTIDNASNNNTTLAHLGVLLHDHSEGKIQWDHTTHHIKCLAHVLNLSCQDFIKVLKGIFLL